jgi:hypothetical protein
MFDKQYKPTKPCPKPKTIKDLFECEEWYKKLE